MLDDYAFVISAFIDLYQATFDEQWLNKAELLTDYTINHFFDANSGMFYYTHNEQSNLISRKISRSKVSKTTLEGGRVYFAMKITLINQDKW